MDSIPCTHGWRPIETAPKTGELILVYWLNKILMAHWDSEFENWQEYPDGDFPVCSDEITHWHPLPKPPSGVTKTTGGE